MPSSASSASSASHPATAVQAAPKRRGRPPGSSNKSNSVKPAEVAPVESAPVVSPVVPEEVTQGVKGSAPVAAVAETSAPAAMTEPKQSTPTPAQSRRARATAAQRADQRIGQIADTFRNAGDQVRLKVLLFLEGGERYVNEIADHTNQAQPVISHQLATLRYGRLVEVERRGKHNFYWLSEAGERIVESARELMEG